jgi:hypothetical protein
MKTTWFLSAFVHQLVLGTLSVSAEPKIREIYTFNDGTYIENLVVRSNGQVLFGTFGQGNVYNIDPRAHSPQLQLVAKLPDADAVTGIAEIAKDVFAVTAGVRTGDFSLDFFKLFKVDLRSKRLGSTKGADARVIANLTGVGLLNGMCALPNLPGFVLSADSSNGTIFRLNTATGEKTAVITDENLKPSRDEAGFPLGVNGIHISGSFLYFTNSARIIFGRVPITRDGYQAGPSEIITEESGGTDIWDDFGIITGSTCHGHGPQALVASHPNVIIQIGLLNGEQNIFLGGGNSSFLYGPTSLAVAKDGKKIYVVTSGAGGPGGQLLEVAI